MVPSRSSVASRQRVELTTVGSSGAPDSRGHHEACRGPAHGRNRRLEGSSRHHPAGHPTGVVASVTRVKSRHADFDTLITLDPTNTLGEALTPFYESVRTFEPS
jgi:hypothetical protein